MDTDHVEKAIKNETKMPEDKSEGYVERRKCSRIERKGDVIETEIIEWKKGGRMERRRRKTSRQRRPRQSLNHIVTRVN